MIHQASCIQDELIERGKQNLTHRQSQYDLSQPLERLYGVAFQIGNASCSTLRLEALAEVERAKDNKVAVERDLTIPCRSAREFILGKFKPNSRRCPVRVELYTSDATFVRASAGTLPVLSTIEAYFKYTFYTSEKATLVIEPHIPIPEGSTMKVTLEAKEFRFCLPQNSTRQLYHLPVSRLGPGEHTVTCEPLQGDKLIAESVAELSKLPPAGREVRGDRLRRIVAVNRRPFFPFGLFLIMISTTPTSAKAKDPRRLPLVGRASLRSSATSGPTKAPEISTA